MFSGSHSALFDACLSEDLEKLKIKINEFPYIKYPMDYLIAKSWTCFYIKNKISLIGFLVKKMKCKNQKNKKKYMLMINAITKETGNDIIQQSINFDAMHNPLNNKSDIYSEQVLDYLLSKQMFVDDLYSLNFKKMAHDVIKKRVYGALDYLLIKDVIDIVQKFIY